MFLCFKDLCLCVISRLFLAEGVSLYKGIRLGVLYSHEKVFHPYTFSIANPVSANCEENGGSLELVTNNDGSQFSMCNFEVYSCEKWIYYRGECAIEEDAEKIKEALIAKDLDLTGMKVVINKHLGKYIGGSVLPVSEPGGGGYVFTYKDGDDVKIVADGNGVIMCDMLKDYPDYPTFLISHCVEEDVNLIAR